MLVLLLRLINLLEWSYYIASPGKWVTCIQDQKGDKNTDLVDQVSSFPHFSNKPWERGTINRRLLQTYKRFRSPSGEKKKRRNNGSKRSNSEEKAFSYN